MAQPNVAEIFRAYIGQFKAKIGEVEGSYEQILDLCEIALGGQALIGGCADILDLAKVKTDLEKRQRERLVGEPMSVEEAIELLKKEDLVGVADAIEWIARAESRDARKLVDILRRVSLVADKPFGLRFAAFRDEVVEGIVAVLMEIIVEWMDDDDTESVDRLVHDLAKDGLGMIWTLASQRMIDGDRLPEKVQAQVGKDGLARIKMASKPAIALRCALIRVKYEERQVERRNRGCDGDRSRDQRSTRVSA